MSSQVTAVMTSESTYGREEHGAQQRPAAHLAVEQQRQAEPDGQLQQDGEHHDGDVVLDGSAEDRVVQGGAVVAQTDVLVE